MRAGGDGRRGRCEQAAASASHLPLRPLSSAPFRRASQSLCSASDSWQCRDAEATRGRGREGWAGAVGRREGRTRGRWPRLAVASSQLHRGLLAVCTQRRRVHAHACAGGAPDGGGLEGLSLTLLAGSCRREGGRDAHAIRPSPRHDMCMCAPGRRAWRLERERGMEPRELTAWLGSRRQRSDGS